jgi:hypothetical protein
MECKIRKSIMRMNKMDDNRRTIGKPNAPYNATKESDVKLGR